LHKELGGKGLAILAFPCNQYGSQEPHPAEWIFENIVKKYNVNFHMMKDVQVTGKRQSPIWKWLRDNSDLKGAEMSWNFEKFLISPQGKVEGHWQTMTQPKDLKNDIQKMLDR